MIRNKLNHIVNLLLLTLFIFSCSLGSSNKPLSDKKNIIYDINRIPSQDPPVDSNRRIIPVHEVPQFIIFGYDDNQCADGMYKIMDVYKDLKNPIGSSNPLTYDGTPARASFYVNPAGMDGSTGEVWTVGQDTIDSWKAAYDAGHEIGNHTWLHERGSEFDVERWKSEIQKCDDFIIDEVGVPRSKITGFRAPYLEYNKNTFIALKELGFEYDCSFEGGWRSSSNEDGSALYWPYTMDTGKPSESEKKDFGNVNGLWELPTDCLFYEDDGRIKRITGLDYDLWYTKHATKKEFIDILKFSLNKKYSGNRSPMNFGGHTNYYSYKDVEHKKKYSPKENDKLVTTVQERTDAIREFLEYALTLPDVRIVTAQQALSWIKKPVPLGAAAQQD